MLSSGPPHPSSNKPWLANDGVKKMNEMSLKFVSLKLFFSSRRLRLEEVPSLWTLGVLIRRPHTLRMDPTNQ